MNYKITWCEVPEFLFRNPGQTNYKTKIIAKDASAHKTICSHLRHGSANNYKSQFISTFSNIWSGLEHQEENEFLLIIESQKLIKENSSVNIYDVSSFEKAIKAIKEIDGRTIYQYEKMAADWANASSEFLIEGEISQKYFHVIPWDIAKFYLNRFGEKDWVYPAINFTEENKDKSVNEMIKIIQPEINKDHTIEQFLTFYDNHFKISGIEKTLNGHIFRVNNDFHERFLHETWREKFDEITYKIVKSYTSSDNPEKFPIYSELMRNKEIIIHRLEDDDGPEQKKIR